MGKVHLKIISHKKGVEFEEGLCHEYKGHVSGI